MTEEEPRSLGKMIQESYKDIYKKQGQPGADKLINDRWNDIYDLKNEGKELVPKFLEGKMGEDDLIKNLKKIKKQHGQAEQAKDLTYTCRYLKVAKGTEQEIKENLEGELEPSTIRDFHYEPEGKIRKRLKKSLEGTQNEIQKMERKIAKRGD